jgi:hypothetical protein
MAQEQFEQQISLHYWESRVMGINRNWVFLIAALLVLLAVSQARADNNENESVFRWDLIHISSFSPNTVVFAGGHDSARANDCVPAGSFNCSKITLTGSGTFELGDPENVTGGGT